MEKLNQGPIKAFIGIGVGTFALLGCGESTDVLPNVPARVVSHEYDDRDSWITYSRVGKITVPITHVDPEHFYLHINQCGHEEFKDDNSDGCGTFKIEVSKETFTNYQDGETITFSE